MSISTERQSLDTTTWSTGMQRPSAPDQAHPPEAGELGKAWEAGFRRQAAAAAEQAGQFRFGTIISSRGRFG